MGDKEKEPQIKAWILSAFNEKIFGETNTQVCLLKWFLLQKNIFFECEKICMSVLLSAFVIVFCYNFSNENKK